MIGNRRREEYRGTSPLCSLEYPSIYMYIIVHVFASQSKMAEMNARLLANTRGVNISKLFEYSCIYW